MAVKELAAANFLTFAEKATSNIKWKHIRHKLKLGNTLTTDMKVEHSNSRIWFAQVATFTKVLHLSASNALLFSTNTSPRALAIPAYSGLPIAHWASVFINHPAYSVLSFNQNAMFELVKNVVTDTFTIHHEVSFEIRRATNVEQVLVLRQGAAVYKMNKNYIGPYE